MPKIVILSDNQPCTVATLGLFDLDDVGPEDPGDFTYQVKAVTGETYTVVYPLADRIKNPPLPPEPGAEEWDLIEYQRFQAALAHHQRRFAIREEYVRNVARRVMEMCLEPQDRQRVVTAADYAVIYNAARPIPLTQEDIAAALRRYFPGSV